MSSSEQAADPLLSTSALRCVRDRRVLFTDLNLHVSPGSIWHVEGPNGSGKTSLLRILCGLLTPQGGAVYWHGSDISTVRADYFSELLYVGHSLGVKLDLTPIENLQFLQAINSPGQRIDTDKAWDALAELGLGGYEDVPVRTLSAGQRRRVALARLWLSDHRLWILDEPLTALDSDAANQLEHRLAAHAANHGIAVLTSHQPLSVETNTLSLA